MSSVTHLHIVLDLPLKAGHLGWGICALPFDGILVPDVSRWAAQGYYACFATEVQRRPVSRVPRAAAAKHAEQEWADSAAMSSTQTSRARGTLSWGAKPAYRCFPTNGPACQANVGSMLKALSNYERRGSVQNPTRPGPMIVWRSMPIS